MTHPMMLEQESIRTRMPQQIQAMYPTFMQVAHGLGQPVTSRAPQTLSFAAQVDNSTRTMQYHDDPYRLHTQDTHQSVYAPTNNPNIPEEETAVLEQTHQLLEYRTCVEDEDDKSDSPPKRQMA